MKRKVSAYWDAQLERYKIECECLKIVERKVRADKKILSLAQKEIAQRQKLMGSIRRYLASL